MKNDETIIISRADYVNMIFENNGLLGREAHTVEHWVNFSLAPQTEDDIRTVAVYSEVNNDQLLCYSFICTYSILSEKFIRELIFITSPFFSLDYYNWKYINLVCKIVCVAKHKRKKLLEKLSEDEDLHPYFRKVAGLLSEKKNAVIVLDKIDWYGILFNQPNISQDFIIEFRNDIDARFLSTFFQIPMNKGGGIAAVYRGVDRIRKEKENGLVEA